jgi:hypothetical protein
MTPVEKARVVELAILDTARYGEPGDVEKLIQHLRDNPNAVEELAKEQDEKSGGDNGTT